MIEQDADIDLPDEFDPNEVPASDDSIAEVEITLTFDDGEQEIFRGNLLRLAVKHGTLERASREAFEFRRVEHNGRSSLLFLIDRNDTDD